MSLDTVYKFMQILANVGFGSDGPGGRSLDDVETEIKDWIKGGRDALNDLKDSDDHAADALWVLKFFGPRFLESFNKTRHLMISTTAGFTWGDALYLTPAKTPYTGMMYGRAGVMGYLEGRTLGNVYRADHPRGIDLYLEWIRFQRHTFQLLTTTVHSAIANRTLRNRFRRAFKIDVVIFRPDQHNRNYVDVQADRWLAVSDWSNLKPPSAAAGRPSFSDRVKNCRWVAVVADEFEEVGRKVNYRNYFGEHAHVSTFGPAPKNNARLEQALRRAHLAPNDVVLVRSDL